MHLAMNLRQHLVFEIRLHQDNQCTLIETNVHHKYVLHQFMKVSFTALN